MQVYPIGIIILASSEDMPGASRSRAYYLQQLSTLVQQWTECSNDGESGDVCKCAPLQLCEHLACLLRHVSRLHVTPLHSCTRVTKETVQESTLVRQLHRVRPLALHQDASEPVATVPRVAGALRAAVPIQWTQVTQTPTRWQGSPEATWAWA